MDETRTTAWTRLELPDLAPGELRTARPDGRQLVVGRDASGCPFALDNRCPHEGYPLASGELKGRSLTCAWHNWKFDVRDGSCTLGGEAVRSYAVRERDGGIEVDLADPAPEELARRALASLREALIDGDVPRALRDGVRVLETGFGARELVAEVAAHDARHAEYGTTHVLAVAADCARLQDDGVLAGSRDERAIEALAPAIDMCADADRRLPARPQPEAVAFAGSDDELGRELRRAVEAEEAERAEGLLLGALDTGASWARVEAWLYASVSDHFLDFGHPLIYLVKARELVEGLDGTWARRLLPALLHGVVLGTREDTLPYMEGYFRRLRASEGELAAIHARARGGPDVELDVAAFRSAVLEGTREEALEMLWGALEQGVSPREIARTLVAAAAHRLWRFDVAVDADRDVVETWLWATHRFTFASAVRNALERFDSPDALRFLVQATAFVHSGRPLDREAFELPEAADGDAEDVITAIRTRHAERAVALTRGLLARGHADELRRGAFELCLDDPLVRPIVVTHAIKTLTAAFEESDALAEHPDRDMPILATVRFLASPLVERRVREAAIRARRWVVEGRMPRKLTN